MKRYVHLLRESWRRAERFRSGSLLLAALGAIAVGAFVELSSELAEGELDALDRAVLAVVIELRVPRLNGAAVDLTALGSFTVLTLLVSIAGVFLALARDRRAIVQLATVAITGGLVTNWLKHTFERQRPDELTRLVEVTSYSYPSGHSFSASSIYLTLALITANRLPSTLGRTLSIAIALLLATAIGASRAYLGVHYPSDITAGLLLGTGWALLVSALFAFVEERAAAKRT